MTFRLPVAHKDFLPVTTDWTTSTNMIGGSSPAMTVPPATFPSSSTAITSALTDTYGYCIVRVLNYKTEFVAGTVVFAFNSSFELAYSDTSRSVLLGVVLTDSK